mmetsp:Transcript_29831/g.69732  ORF Transcript_29831/g.69732 Transcript_29831/m.69732 type:complete len:292 (-) Transcript_29831:93-968(-)
MARAWALSSSIGGSPSAAHARHAASSDAGSSACACLGSDVAHTRTARKCPSRTAVCAATACSCLCSCAEPAKAALSAGVTAAVTSPPREGSADEAGLREKAFTRRFSRNLAGCSERARLPVKSSRKNNAAPSARTPNPSPNALICAGESSESLAGGEGLCFATSLRSLILAISLKAQRFPACEPITMSARSKECARSDRSRCTFSNSGALFKGTNAPLELATIIVIIIGGVIVLIIVIIMVIAVIIVVVIVVVIVDDVVVLIITIIIIIDYYRLLRTRHVLVMLGNIRNKT